MNDADAFIPLLFIGSLFVGFLSFLVFRIIIVFRQDRRKKSAAQNLGAGLVDRDVIPSVSKEQDLERERRMP